MAEQGERDDRGRGSENEDRGHENKSAASQEGADTAKTGTGGKGGDHIDTDGGNPDEQLHK
ncbi:hypothetical protein [Cryobacterium tepidiphilum]|uniref:Uncharacterized protein n=1 Tax=Cryobacterium tepidiphilum TaxID=2486026 RepID=A0A3M8LE30_9MICO|nr:hypothetical protein [Cryobacterium tepidiphilum]RNE63813.1 hypothetical protein EEJ31_06200 [Cryobacterium tepidiphilum]